MLDFSQFLPNTRYGQITLAAAIAEAIIVISLESVVASMFLPHYSELRGTSLKGIPVYLMIFLFSQVFQVVLCWDAVYHQNTIQIIGFVIFNGCCFLYSLIQYTQITSAMNNPEIPIPFSLSVSAVSAYLITITIILGISIVVFGWLAFKLYLEFGWKIYKKIGADPKMKNMYRSYQIFLMLLKLDFFFFLAFSVQFLLLILEQSDYEFALTIIALPCTIFVIYMAVYGLRNENGKIMVLFLAGCLLAMSYFIFKLVRIHQPSEKQKYLNTTNFLTFFASLSLFVVTLTLVNAVVCLMNFGKGLKQHIATSQYSASNNNGSTSAGKQPQTAQTERKMVIE